MPLRLIKNIAAKLLGRSTTVQIPDRPARAGDRARRPAARKPEPARREDRPATAPHAAAGRAERPHAAAAPARSDARRESPRNDGRGPRRPDRPDARGARPAARSPRPAPEQGRSDPAAARPGGAVNEAETSRRREAHAAWSPEQYQVPPAEGKKRFQDFDLPSEILHAIADLNFQYCTPIQALSLEHALAGKNVAGKAQTGTGKTAAFLVALLTRYLRTPEARNAEPGRPRALVIAPTRELVIQICKDADALGKYCGLRYLAVYGGMDHDRQRNELQAGPVDLLVATPGRLLDFVSARVIDLSRVDTLVIDEADRMLDMGFIPDVKRIIFRLPPKERRSTMLYGATLNDDVIRLAAQWMTEPVRVDIDAGTLTIDTVKQVVYIVTAREKFTVLHNILRIHADRRVLVFCNRRDSTERVADRLNRFGIPCEMLSGDVQQNRRLRVLDDFRSGKIRVVVATDVAGRGLHVDDIGFVVNFDFPYEADDYVHRIGRTGRAGNTGTAISFADEDESFIIPEIEKYIGEPLKCIMPEEALLQPLPDARGQHRPPHRQGEPRHSPPPPHRQDEPRHSPPPPQDEPARPAPAAEAPRPTATAPAREEARQPEKPREEEPARKSERARHPGPESRPSRDAEARRGAPAHARAPSVDRTRAAQPRSEPSRVPAAVVPPRRTVTEEWTPGQTKT